MSTAREPRLSAEALAARARELDLLQELARRAAEAQTPVELFRVAADVLQRCAEPDLILALWAVPDGWESHAFLTRATGQETLTRLTREAIVTCDLKLPALPRIRCSRLDEFDARQPPRSGFRETELDMLPLLRRRVAVGALALVGGREDEQVRRLVFGIANQCALQLDRILTVREAERGRFRDILDSMPQAVFLTDPELSVIGANRSAEQLRGALGLPGSGGSLRRVAGVPLAPLAERALAGEVAEDELTAGEDRRFTVTVSTFGEQQPHAEGLVVVLADVTERRRLAAQLAQSERLSSLGQMLSGVAHELNNPLASVVGFAQLIQDRVEDPKLSRRLAMIGEQATRCQRVVGNLLSFARRHEPVRRRLSLNETARSVASLMRYQLRVEGVRLELDLDPDAPPVLGDPHQFQQVVVNLVTNAQHALSGDEGGCVTIRTRRDGTDTLLEVMDDGPGIPQSLHEQVFEPFFTTKPDGQGTGLGLALVHGIVVAHGGRIELAAAPSGGACFALRFPQGTVEGTESSEPPEDEVHPSAHGRILIVDDEPTVAELLCDVLAADGHDVQPVGDGGEALRRLGEERFDLVISDLKMPVMGGARLFEEIRRRRPGLACRVLWTTGDTIGPEPEALARSSGVPLLHKPFDVQDLKRQVRRCLVDPLEAEEP